MFFLDNYDTIIENYKAATGVLEEYLDAEHHRFLKDMEDLKMTIEEIKKKERVSAADHEKIAYQYSLIYRLYREQMKNVAAKNERLYFEFEDECKAIIFMDIHSEKDFEGILSDAKELATFLGRGKSKSDEPHIGYMSDLQDADMVKKDLAEDQALFQELDASIVESKKGVFGSPSPQYEEMEKTYLALKEKNRELLEEGDYSEEKIKEYKMSLNALTRAAKEYETYKLSNAQKNHKALKKKEEKRVNTSRLLQKYAGRRAQKIENTIERALMFERVDLKLKSIDIKHSNDLKNRKTEKMNMYASRMLELSDKMKFMPSNNGDADEFADSILNRLNVNTVNPQQRIHTVKKVIMGAYGNISKDPVFTREAEVFLKNSKVSKVVEGGEKYSGMEFFNSALGAAHNAERNTPYAYADSVGNAVVHFVKKASEMTSIEPNFSFLADLAVFTSHAEQDKNKLALPSSLMKIVDGLNEANKIVKQGVESWKRMMAVKPNEKAEYNSEDMLNYVTMRVLESGMETFCNKNTGKRTNPIFAILGSTENGAKELKKAIAASASMKAINEKWTWREKAHLLANKNNDYDKAFTKLMKSSFDKAFDIKNKKHEEPSNNAKILL